MADAGSDPDESQQTEESMKEQRTGREGRAAVATAAEQPPRVARRPLTARERAVEWFKSLAVIVVLFFLIRTFLVQTFVITSGSMEETLLVGDFLLISKAAYGAVIPGTETRLPGYAEPHRGDIIVFRADHEPELDLVKRLIGLPGDTVQMRNGVVYVNGAAQVEPYVKAIAGAQDVESTWFRWQSGHVLDSGGAGRYRPTLHNWGPVVVPEGHYFVLGDNREQSLDSRFWGFVEAPKVKGKAEFLYWSYDPESLKPFAWLLDVRWGRIGDGIH